MAGGEAVAGDSGVAVLCGNSLPVRPQINELFCVLPALSLPFAFGIYYVCDTTNAVANLVLT